MLYPCLKQEVFLLTCELDNQLVCLF